MNTQKWDQEIQLLDKDFQIPKSIFYDSNLTAYDKIILTALYSYLPRKSDKVSDYITITNETLGEFCCCDSRTVANTLPRLARKGCIVIDRSLGRKRRKIRLINQM